MSELESVRARVFPYRKRRKYKEKLFNFRKAEVREGRWVADAEMVGVNERSAPSIRSSTLVLI